MNLKGIPVSRWIDGVLEDKKNMDQPDNVRAMVLWGHAPNSQTRMKEMKTAMEKLDMLVVIDPYPTVSAVLHDRTDGVYLLPASTQFETYGSVTASNRSIQWREKGRRSAVREPARPGDHGEVRQEVRLGGPVLPQHQAGTATSPWSRTSPARSTRGMWTIGYTGQSPERLKLHMANQHTFDKTTLQAVGGPADGDYYGMPWPCWGTAEMGHPGTPNLYDMSKRVSEGGLTFRARFGVERRREPAGRGRLLGRFGDPGRLSRVHHADADGPGLGQGPDRRGA